MFRCAGIRAFAFFCLLAGINVQQIHAADWVYSVKPGDTLWSICEKYTKEPDCWLKLGDINQISKNRQIPPGKRVSIPATWLKVPPAAVEIVFVRGIVKYQNINQSEKDATSGDRLYIGGKITSKDGSATLRFADGSELIIVPHTEVILDELSNFELTGMADTSIRLNKGTIKTRVIKKEAGSRFRTITPSAVAAVRGTEYRVNVVPENESKTSKGPNTLVEVYQGAVDVGAEETTYEVQKNFGVVTKFGQPPTPPERLLPPPSFLSFDKKQVVSMTGQMMLDPLKIEWQNTDKAKAFQLNVLLEDEKSESLLQSYQSVNTEVELKGLVEGCYTLSLRAIANSGLHGQAATKPLCLEKKIAAPSIALTPEIIDGKTIVRLNWKKVIGADRYLVRFSKGAAFLKTEKHFYTTETEIILPANEEHYVLVQALKEDHSSADSNLVHWQPAKPESNHWQALIPIGLFLIGLL